MPRGRKRMLDSEENLPAVSITINALPDEMLITIFARLDSVSRKRAERVCSRWLALLRETVSLQKHVKIDRSFLPRNLGDGLCQNVYKAGPQEKLRKAIRRFVLDNLVVETLHITDENNPARPWSSTVSLVNKEEQCFIERELDMLATDLFSSVTDPWRVCAPPRMCRIIFEKLVLRGYDVCVGGFFSAGSENSPLSIELKDVKVCGLTLMQLSQGGEHPEHYSDQKCALTRTVAAATIRYNCAACPTEPFVQLMDVVGQNEEPLTLEEEERFRQLVGSVAETGPYKGAYKGSQLMLRDVLESMSGRQLTLDDIKNDSTLTPFQKRLVLTGKEAIAFWDSEEPELDDHDYGDDDDEDQDEDDEADYDDDEDDEDDDEEDDDHDEELPKAAEKKEHQGTSV